MEERKEEKVFGGFAHLERKHERTLLSFIPSGRGRIIDRQRLGQSAPDDRQPRSLGGNVQEWGRHTKQHFRTWWAQRRDTYCKDQTLLSRDGVPTDVLFGSIEKWFNGCESFLKNKYVQSKKVEGQGRKTKCLIENLEEVYAISKLIDSMLERMETDFQQSPDMKDEVSVLPARPKNGANVLYVWQFLLQHEVRAHSDRGGHSSSSKKMLEQVTATCGVLEEVITNKGYFLPGKLYGGALWSWRKQNNPYNVFVANVLCQMARRMGYEYSNAKESELEVSVGFLAGIGVRDFREYTDCVKAFNLIVGSLRAARSNAIQRAATARGRIRKEDLASTYEQLYEELQAGESIVFNMSDAVMFENDSALANMHVISTGAYAWPQNWYAGLIPFDLVPIIQPYINWYCDRERKVSVSKTEEGEMQISIHSNARAEVSTGARIMWATGYATKFITLLESLTLACIDLVVFQRTGRIRHSAMTFTVPTKEDKHVVRRMMTGQTNLAEIIKKAQDSRHSFALKRRLRSNVNASLVLVQIFIWMKNPKLTPKYFGGFARTRGRVRVKERGWTQMIEAPGNREENAQTEFCVEEKTETFRSTAFVNEGQMQMYANHRSIHPMEFGAVVEGGFVFRNIFAVYYRIWDDFDHLSAHAVSISVVPPAVKGELPRVAITFANSPSRKSEKLPLDGFNVETLVRLSCDERIARFVEDVNRRGECLEVQCEVPADIVRMCYRDEGNKEPAIHQDMLLRAIKKRRPALRITRISTQTDTSYMYKTRLCWAWYFYFLVQDVAAGIEKPPAKVLDVEWDVCGRFQHASIRHPEADLNAGRISPADVLRQQLMTRADVPNALLNLWQ